MSSSSSTELPVLRTILSAALDEPEENWLISPAWTSTATMYYDRLAKHIEATDPNIMDMLYKLLRALRSSYRSHSEHEHYVQCVPLEKQPESSVTSTLTDVCCVCLVPLHAHRISRLRPASLDPTICGHFIHTRCMDNLRPATIGGRIQCPICRTDLGRHPIKTWKDTERAIPRF